MIQNCIPDSAKEDFLKGVHQPDDDYKIALFTSEAELGPLTVLYLPLNEATGIGYIEGGIQLSGYTVSRDGAAFILSFFDPKWETVSISARGAVIYNASKSNKVIKILDFGEDVTSTNDSFTVNLPDATAETGLIRVS